MFLLYFYNQVLGLDPFLCGLGIALSLFVDAFTDPMIGGISDRSATRFGRRIPYMAFGLFGFALAYSYSLMFVWEAVNLLYFLNFYYS